MGKSDKIVAQRLIPTCFFLSAMLTRARIIVVDSTRRGKRE